MPPHHPPVVRPTPRGVTGESHKRLWESIINATDTEAIRLLATALADKDGSSLTGYLEPEAAARCIDILDRVS